MLITPPGSGMSCSIAPGEAWVAGSSAATQSGYYCRVSSSTSLSIATSSPSNPRIDRISAVVTDAAYSGATNTFAPVVLTGTPTASATLVNLLGVAAAPASSLTLGYVLVPASATNIISADISNVATQAVLGLSGSWAALTLGSPGSTLSAVGGGYTPSFKKQEDRVYFAGAIQSSGGTTDGGTWATGLPAPASTVRISIAINGASPTATEFQVSTSGNLTLTHGSAGAITADLDGLSYRLI